MIAYIAMGTNIDNRFQNLQDAVDALSHVPLLKVLSVSKVYETVPVGYLDQQDFLNAVVKVDTDITPEALLGVCLGIEAGMGRIRNIKNGPRIIDLDLLLYGQEIRNTDFLTLPHPRMREREFVLRPLLDVYKDFDLTDCIKLNGEGIKEYIKRLEVNTK